MSQSRPTGGRSRRIDILDRASPKKLKKTQKNYCYGFLPGRWSNLPIHLVINPTNPQGLSEEFVVDAVMAAAETWNKATRLQVFDREYTINYSVGIPNADDMFTITFADFGFHEIIASASVLFSCPEDAQCALIGFDIQLDTQFSFGDAALDPSVVDLQSIMTHELGHALGLADVWDEKCSEVTMFGFSEVGDVSKRTLERADVKGLRRLYRNFH